MRPCISEKSLLQLVGGDGRHETETEPTREVTGARDKGQLETTQGAFSGGHAEAPQPGFGQGFSTCPWSPT